MRPGNLPGRVVERLNPDVIRIEREEPGAFPQGHPAELGDDHLNHEASAGLQVRGRVGEDRQLSPCVVTFMIVFATRYTSMRVPGHAGDRHVADGHGDRASASLANSCLPPRSR
jgi:hypothetical protein